MSAVPPTARPLAVLVAFSALVAALPFVPAEGGADGVVVRVEPWIAAVSAVDSLLVKPVQAADGQPYYLWSVRVSVRGAGGAWTDVPLDPASTFLRITPVEAEGSARVVGGADAFAFAGDATRVLVAVPKSERPAGVALVSGVAGGYSGAYNALKARASADVADALDEAPTPVLFNETSAGRYAYSVELEIVPSASGYDVRATPLSPFVEQTTVRTRDGAAPLTLDRSAPAAAAFPGDPVGVVATTDGTRFSLPSRATFGDPVARFLLCKTAAPCGTSILQILSRENATANGTYSISPPGEPLAHRWDWGDGFHAAGSEARYDWKASGVFTVTLNVTDPEGRSDEASVPLTVLNQPPTGSVTVTPDPATRITVTTARATATDSDGAIVKYVWYVDGVRAPWDAGTPALAIPRGALALGSHKVRALFQDNGGAFGAAELTFQVVNLPPVALATVSRPAVQPGVPLTFTSVSTDADGTIASVAWDFGDGSTGAGATATHAYATVGDYAPTVTVTDSDGAVSTAALAPILVDATPPTMTVTVPQPAASGWYTSSSVTFSITASDDRLPPPRVYATVDGVTTLLNGPALRVEGEGAHAVLLRAVDAAGNEVSRSYDVQIDSKVPTIEFAPPSLYASGVERLELAAEDETSGVVRLEIRIDGKPFATLDGPGPLVASWDTTGEVYGKHAIQVRAQDAAGHLTLLSYNVMVLNVPLGLPPPELP